MFFDVRHRETSVGAAFPPKKANHQALRSIIRSLIFRSIKTGEVFPFSLAPLDPGQNEGGYGFLEPYSTESFASIFALTDERMKLLGDGMSVPSPLIRIPELFEASDCSNVEIFVKDESVHPTGSFKDRQNQILFAVAESLGIQTVRVVSSGNGALSAAYFGKLLGIHVRAAVSPGEIPFHKRMLLEQSGCSLDLIGSCYEEAYRETLYEGRECWNISPGINPLVEIGLSRIGYELLTQQPELDHVLCPVGNGALTYGLWLGMNQYVAEHGETRVPSIHGFQMKGFAPLKDAMDKGTFFEILENEPSPNSEAFLIKESFCAPKALEAIRLSAGSLTEVTEADLNEVRPIVSACPFTTEYAALSAYAGARKLVSRGDIAGKIAIINCASDPRFRGLSSLCP